MVRAMIGIIMTPRAKPPAIAEKRRTGRTETLYAKIPMTIDGTPFSASAAKRTADAKREPRYSAT